MANLLFDVILCDANNEPIKAHVCGVPMTEAIQHSTLWNLDPDNRPVAVVVMAGTVQCSLEASRNASNALDETDDSEAEDDSEDAAEANVVDELYEGVAKRRAKFVQSELRKQIKRIWAAVPLVSDGADLGIVAASLEVVSRAVDGVCEEDLIHERFDYGLHGDLRYHELEDALGVVRRDVRALKRKVLLG